MLHRRDIREINSATLDPTDFSPPSPGTLSNHSLESLIHGRECYLQTLVNYASTIPTGCPESSTSAGRPLDDWSS